MLSTSRQQVLASESRDGIIFERKGWYVSRWVCCLLVVAAVLGALIVGVATFYISRENSLFKSNTVIWTETDSPTTSQASTNSRLPTSVIPSFYRLKLIPNLGESIFNGEVYITLKTADNDVNSIVLHSKGLNIQKPIKVTEQVYEKIQNVRMKRGIPELVNAAERVSDSAFQMQPLIGRTKRSENDKNDANQKIESYANTEDSKQSGTEIKDAYQKKESNTHINQSKHNDQDVNDENQNIEPKLITDDSKHNKRDRIEESQISTGKKHAEFTKLHESDESRTNHNTEATLNFNIDKNEKNHSNFNNTNYKIKEASDIKSRKTQVTQSHMKNINITKFELDKNKETIILHLASTLKPNTDYTLEINFDGNITYALNGFYKSSYIDNKKAKVLAITQFEPTYARAAFPCFDEPKFKAMFEISIAHPSNLTALSNMPITETETMLEKPGWVWTHYARSVRMSTYLVAYGIVDFDFLESEYKSKDNTTKTIRVWMRRELKEQGRYALGITRKLLMFYEDVFGVPYALPKIDLIAIPDFSAGAMENWGLLTFRETALLLKNDGTVSHRQNIATSVAHELAHQWFGNLVTMSWWNDLWLNEGFATYVEYLGMDHVEPQWNILNKLTTDKMELLRADAYKHTTPLTEPAEDSSEIAEKFDAISYQKGASLISMLNHTITETLFRKGLVAYLNKWKFSNAEEKDLWSAMSETVTSADPKVEALNGIDIVKFMTSWTHQAGYPVLMVKRHYNGSVTFMQTLFTSDLSSKSESIWTIPITYTSINTPRNNWNSTPKLWLQNRENTVALPLKNEETLYVNIGGIGYYRVNYDEENWRRLTNTLKHNVSILPPLTRAQLIDDAFNLAKVSLLPYETVLNLTAFITNEEDRTVWEVLLSNIAFLKSTLQYTPHYINFQDYMLRMLTPILMKHNYGIGESAGDNASLLQQTLVSWECLFDSPRCVHWAQGLFKQWMDKPDFRDNPIPSNARYVVYSTAARHGGRSEFDFLWRVFKNSTDPYTNEATLSALSSTRDDALMRLLLERSLTEIPAQSVGIAWSLESVGGRKLAMEYLTEDWERIHAKFEKMDSSVLGSIVDAAFGEISTQQELDRYKTFVGEHHEELRPYRQGLLHMEDSALVRINWLRTHANTVGSWLARTPSENVNSTSKDVSTEAKNRVDVVQEEDSTTKTTPLKVHPTNGNKGNFEKNYSREIFSK